MQEVMKSFALRARKVEKTHRKLAKGYDVKTGKDQVTRYVPKASGGFSPLRIVLVIAMGFVALKGFLLAGLGQEKYSGHLAEFQAGNMADQFGGWIMQVDPITQRISQVLVPLVANL